MAKQRRGTSTETVLSPMLTVDDFHGRAEDPAPIIPPLSNYYWGHNAMAESDVNGLAELGEDVLTFDVSDDALERVAEVAGGQAVTIGYCTHWYTCSWPM